MSDWPTATLGELCAEGGGFVRTGPFGSQLHQSDYIDDPDAIPVVMPKDMVNGRVDQDSVARISADTAKRLAHHLAEPGDVILSRRGDVGRSVSIRHADVPVLTGTGAIRIHLGTPERVNPKYFEYFMRSRHVVDYLEGQAVGATMPNLNAGIVNSLPVFVPPAGHQYNTAEVLGAIDDLIENNRRRIAVLEEMAQAIYREWFVHFRFPGHESTTFKDSPLGPIPEDWEATTVGGVLELKYGKALKKDDRSGGDVAVIGSSGVVGAHDTSLIDGPAIIVGRKGNVGNVVWADGPTWPIDTTYFVETGLPLRYVSEQLKNAAFINSHAAVPGLSRDQAYSTAFLLPSRPAMERFQAVAELLGQQRRQLARLVDLLTEMRDRLLPKLVTGEIDVSDLDLDEMVGQPS